MNVKSLISPVRLTLLFFVVEISYFTLKAFGVVPPVGSGVHVYDGVDYVSVYWQVFVIYAGVIIWMSLMWFVTKDISPASGNDRELLFRFIGPRFDVFVAAISIILFLWSLWFVIDVDLGALWEYSRYLQRRSYEELGLVIFITQIYGSKTFYFGLLGVVAFGGALLRGRIWLVLMSLFSVTISWVVMLSNHSRGAALCFLLMCMFAYVRKGVKSVLFYMFLFVAVLSYISAMSGRDANYNNNPGLRTAIVNLGRGDVWRDGFGKSFFNVFNGACNVGYVLQIGAGEYPLDYKILSFSPALSIIDGFDSVRDQCQIRINKYCPYGNMAELLGFGSVYVFLYVIVYSIALFLVEYLFKKNIYISMLPMMVYMFVLVRVTHYPIRNTERMLYLCIAVSVCLIALLNKRMKERVR